LVVAESIEQNLKLRVVLRLDVLTGALSQCLRQIGIALVDECRILPLLASSLLIFRKERRISFQFATILFIVL
jgi:hypothetical protein